MPKWINSLALLLWLPTVALAATTDPTGLSSTQATTRTLETTTDTRKPTPATTTSSPTTRTDAATRTPVTTPRPTATTETKRQTPTNTSRVINPPADTPKRSEPSKTTVQTPATSQAVTPAQGKPQRTAPPTTQAPRPAAPASSLNYIEQRSDINASRIQQRAPQALFDPQVLAQYAAKEVILISADMSLARQAQAQLRPLGARLIRRKALPQLDMVISTFRITNEQTAAFIGTLQHSAPELEVAPNHYYRPQSSRDYNHDHKEAVGLSASPPCTAPLRLGLVDGPINTKHPAFAKASITVKQIISKGRHQ